MKRHRFYIEVCFAYMAEYEEIVELPEELTDEEVEAEFKKWVWNLLEVSRTELPKE